jgi:polar amino acid transport system substrate-binding protein
LFSAYAFAETKEVVLAADRWCPINCGENDPMQGFMIDIARLALHPAGYRVRYIEMPWQRALAMARAGEINGVVGTYPGEAPDFLFPRYPLMIISGNTLFTRIESDWRYKGLASLEGIRLGTVRGYSYGEELDPYIENHTLNAARIHLLTGKNPVERNIKLLLSGRIDAMIDSPPVVWYTAKNLNVTELLREAGQADESVNTYIAFSPRRDDSLRISQALDVGVATLRRNGRVEELAHKYGLPETVIPKDIEVSFPPKPD